VAAGVLDDLADVEDPLVVEAATDQLDASG